MKLANDEAGHYTSLSNLASYLQEITKKIGTPIYGENYPGADFLVSGNTIMVSDGTAPPKVTDLQFQDLIGQVTWISPAQVSFTTVLRADLTVFNQVKFPQGIGAPFALTSASAATGSNVAPASSKTSFQGTFKIQECHHYANFRQPDAQAWNTTFTAATLGTNP